MDNQIKANIPKGSRSKYSQVKYKFMIGAPFNISSACCTISKKKPAHDYNKETGRVAITAQMASESRLRTQQWLKSGCNAFDNGNPISNPMSFWTEEDVLEYIYTFKLPICKVYKDVEIENPEDEDGQINISNWLGMELFDKNKPCFKTTGCKRTGCVGCGFGAHFEEENRWEIAERVSNPQMVDLLMRGGAFDPDDGLWKPDNRGFGYWFVLKWINLHSNGKVIIEIPHEDKYIAEYSTKQTDEYLYSEKIWIPQIG